MTNDYDGTLVAVEGIDGSGKGTLIDSLQENYSNDNDIIFTKEPSDGIYGQTLRDSLRQQDEPTPADFFGFLADRYDHCNNVIEPALEEGKTVITDRYALSTYAYQSKVLDEELGIIDPIDYIDELTYHFTIEPDLYLYIQISPEKALDRIEAEDKYENMEDLEEAKRIYDFLCEEKENVISIPGVWQPEGIFNEAKMWIENIDE